MEIELKSESDLAKAYQGKYEGFDINLRRISNEAKARKGEYDGFGTYPRRISQEAKANEATTTPPLHLQSTNAVDITISCVWLPNPPGSPRETRFLSSQTPHLSRQPAFSPNPKATPRKQPCTKKARCPTLDTQTLTHRPSCNEQSSHLHYTPNVR